MIDFSDSEPCIQTQRFTAMKFVFFCFFKEDKTLNVSLVNTLHTVDTRPFSVDTQCKLSQLFGLNIEYGNKKCLTSDLRWYVPLSVV